MSQFQCHSHVTVTVTVYPQLISATVAQASESCDTDAALQKPQPGLQSLRVALPTVPSGRGSGQTRIDASRGEALPACHGALWQDDPAARARPHPRPWGGRHWLPLKLRLLDSDSRAAAPESPSRQALRPAQALGPSGRLSGSPGVGLPLTRCSAVLAGGARLPPRRSGCRRALGRGGMRMAHGGSDGARERVPAARG